MITHTSEDYSNYGGLVVGTMEYQASESGSNPGKYLLLVSCQVLIVLDEKAHVCIGTIDYVTGICNKTVHSIVPRTLDPCCSRCC